MTGIIAMGSILSYMSYLASFIEEFTSALPPSSLAQAAAAQQGNQEQAAENRGHASRHQARAFLPATLEHDGQGVGRGAQKAPQELLAEHVQDIDAGLDPANADLDVPARGQVRKRPSSPGKAKAERADSRKRCPASPRTIPSSRPAGTGPHRAGSPPTGPFRGQGRAHAQQEKQGPFQQHPFLGHHKGVGQIRNDTFRSRRSSRVASWARGSIFKLDRENPSKRICARKCS
jgi:hypothetical protein